jgi:hypothetical protein
MFRPGPRLQLRLDAAYDEHVTTFWVLSGGHYRVLLAAVLALPLRSYDSEAQVWVVAATGLLQLQEAGRRVEPGFLDQIHAARAHRITRAYLRWLVTTGHTP